MIRYPEETKQDHTERLERLIRQQESEGKQDAFGKWIDKHEEALGDALGPRR
jgi:hypothetical protein